MSKSPTLNELVARGYLPKELPPCFTSERFGDNAGRALAKAQKTTSSWLGLSLARTGRIRRALAIPNPREQVRLSDLVVNHWADLDTAMRRDHISLSVAVPDGRQHRAVAAEHWFDRKPIMRVRSQRHASHLIRSDISRFYGSIYTHSLEWVELGKEAARAALASGGRPNGWGTKIDVAARACNENQTIGVPVGPDTSLVLSEAILSTALQPLALDRTQAWRYSDDLEIAAESAAHADELLGQVEAALAQFHLALNPLKSAVVELPDAFTDTHIARLRTQPIRWDSPTKFQNDAIEVMSSAHELAASVDEAVSYVKFALGRIGREFWTAARNWEFGKTVEPWSTVLAMHLGSVHAEPSSFPLLDRWLEKSFESKMPVPVDEVAQTVELTVKNRAPRNHSYEVVWAIYIATRLGIQLSDESARTLDGSSDAMIHTMGMAGLHWGSVPRMPTTGYEAAESDPSSPSSEFWMLGYQAWRFGLTGGSHFSADPFFERLDELEIDFLVMPQRYQRPPVKGLAAVGDTKSTAEVSGVGSGSSADDKKSESDRASTQAVGTSTIGEHQSTDDSTTGEVPAPAFAEPPAAAADGVEASGDAAAAGDGSSEAEIEQPDEQQRDTVGELSRASGSTSKGVDSPRVGEEEQELDLSDEDQDETAVRSWTTVEDLLLDLGISG